jgi:hypothetical protein
VTGAALLAHAAGAVLTVADGRVVVDGASRLAPDMLADPRAHKANFLLTAITVKERSSSAVAPAPVLSRDAPSAPCWDCGGGLWWRLSVLSGRPGPWSCERCIPPDPAGWRDACSIPTSPHNTTRTGRRHHRAIRPPTTKRRRSGP